MSANTQSAKRATQIYFLICGLGLSAWAPLVPFAKDRLQLNDSNLGLLLLFLGIGAFCTMPLTGWLAQRIGTKIIILITALIIAIALPALAIVDTFVGMAVTLFVFGMGIGGIDVAMNTHGSLVQGVLGKPIMSGLHGLFSVGGLCGPLLVSGLLKAGLSPFMAVSILAGCILLMAVGGYKGLFDHQDEKQLNQTNEEEDTGNNNKKSAWLNGTVIFLGVMCFISFLSEGAMIDWAALLLRDYRGADEEIAGIGYAAFSIAMATMRFAGDKIIARFNSHTVVILGSFIAFIGYGIILSINWLPASLLGFVLIGVGASNIVPVFFSQAGSMKVVSAAAAVSVMATIGYTGQLAGPAILGFLAQHFTLPVALFTTGVLTLISGCCYWLWQRKSYI
ncbi:MAG: MFS transporter [Sphingobacteriaceae bacterium]|nr:MAG: MFS transporter [Sphingobacteriaceae bacterium]